MGLRETIVQAVRAWYIAATGLAVGKVIPADDKGAKPSPPFVTVRVGALLPVGVDESREHASGRRMIGQRKCTITVHAYGKQTDAIEEYHEQAALALGTSSVAAALTAAGLSIERYGPVVEVPPGFVDTAIQQHHARDYTATFAIRAATAETVAAFDYAEIALTYHDTDDADDDADPLTDTVQTPPTPGD